MAKKPEKDRDDFSFFSWRGTHGERMPTAEEVLERNFEKIKKAQDSIEIVKPQKGKRAD